MKILIAKSIKTMGDKDPTYGQTYYGTVHDQEMPVMFNLMDVLDIPEGAKIQSEEYVIKTSAKGNDYMRLKKVKVEGATTQTTIVPPPNDVMKMLEIINSKLDGILDKLDPPLKDPFDEPEQEDTTE